MAEAINELVERSLNFGFLLGHEPLLVMDAAAGCPAKSSSQVMGCLASGGLPDRRVAFAGCEAAAAGFPSLQVTIQGRAPGAGTAVFVYGL